MVQRRLWLAVIAVILTVFAGCKSGSGCAAWYLNKGALASTLEKPVRGNPDERTFVDACVKGRTMGAVYIEPVEIKATTSGRDVPRFLDKVAAGAQVALKKVVEESGRFKNIADKPEEASFILSTTMLAHIATLEGRVVNDPAWDDPRSKVFVIYSLKDAKNGKVFLKHTGVFTSQWEHAPMAMEELEVAGVATARDFLYVLEHF